MESARWFTRDEARLLIDTIRQEMAESELALENSSDDSESYNERYQWLPLAAAAVELRARSDMAKVMAELRGYCHLDGEREVSESYENTQRHDRCLKAYALLVAEGKPEEADALLYDAYRADAESRFINDASLAGLAEIEARRGRSAEATRLLSRLPDIQLSLGLSEGQLGLLLLTMSVGALVGLTEANVRQIDCRTRRRLRHLVATSARYASLRRLAWLEREEAA